MLGILSNTLVHQQRCLLRLSDSLRSSSALKSATWIKFSPNGQSSRRMHRYQQDTIRLMYWRGRSFDAVKFKDRLKSDWLDWNYKSELFAFSRRFNENLSETTLRTIFTFRCYLDNLEKQQKDLGMKAADLQYKCNSDLIDRGTELLESFTKSYLRFTFNRMPEEGIEEICNYLLSQDVLQDIARWIGCYDIILSAELPPSGEKMAESIKALVAGIDLDFGVDKARNFVIDFILTYIHDKDIFDDIWKIPEPIAVLKMILRNDKSEYEPRIMFHTGINTIESCFVVGIYANKKLIGYGPGETLKIAETSAALDCLQRLWGLKESRAPMLFGKRAYKIDYNRHSSKHLSMNDWTLSTLDTDIATRPDIQAKKSISCK